MAYTDLNELMLEAHDAIKKEKLDEALPRLKLLINKAPWNHYVLYLWGAYHSKMEDHGLSIIFYEAACKQATDFSEAINNVGGSYRKLGYQDKAIEAFKRAVEIGRTEKFKKDAGQRADGLLSDYLSNIGSAYVGMHSSKQALQYLNEALEVNPDCTNAHWNKALACLELGDYETGFYEYEFGDRRLTKKQGRHYKAHINDAPETPFWDGQHDKTVVVYGEQGIGDEIMFATLLPDLAAVSKKVIYDCHPRLYRMFRRAFKHLGIDCFGTRKDHQLSWCCRYDVDYKIPLGSLAKHFRKSASDFPGQPYLPADANDVKAVTHRFENLPKKRLNIGLSWKGGTDGSHKTFRHLPMKFFDKLFDEIDANFISLQYDENGRLDVDIYEEKTGNTIHHWQKEIDDYDLTSAMVSKLDCIISVPQSVVHLAGAMDVRTFQLCPYNHIWQMGVYGQDMPWYSSVTNIWQQEHAGWEYTMDEAIKMVKKEFNL